MAPTKDTQSKLQEILNELNRPAQYSDMPNRIKFCEQALEIVSREVQPELWAGLQDVLANTLMRNPMGVRQENIELAIDHYKQALDVYSDKDYPEDWAMIQNNLGEAYRVRISGKRAENLEKSIAFYKRALRIRNQKKFPLDWAMTQNNLANAYAERIKGERAQNIEQAIAYYRQALLVRTRQSTPEGWATTQNNLAAAYAERILGERAENIEQAIECYKQTLSVRTRELFPRRWAAVQNNLANAYKNRIQGERAENIEQAIHHCTEALKVRTFHDLPWEWAMTQNNLAIAYTERIHGKRSKNIEQAIHHYTEALKIRTQKADPKRWAITQNNLANTYKNRIEGVPAENIEQAIMYYLKALEVYTFQLDPEHWAGILNNLANTYKNRLQGLPTENIKLAIEYFQQVLEVYTEHAFPEHWAMTQGNLGNAYAALASTDIKNGNQDKSEKAVFHYKQALKIYTSKAFPNDCRRIAQLLGDLAFSLDDWQLASEIYEKAFTAQDVLVHSALTRKVKQIEIKKTQAMSHRATYAYVQLGDHKRAVEVLEKGRAQLLREALERQRHDLEELPSLGFENLYQDYLQAAEIYTTFQVQNRDGQVRLADHLVQMEEAHKNLSHATRMIREEAGISHAQYSHFLKPLSFAEIQKQANKSPLVYIIVTPSGGLALIVSKQGVRVYPFPELTEDILRSKVFGIKEDTSKLGYLDAYESWQNNPAGKETSIAWFKALDDMTSWLWDIGMGAVVDELRKTYESIILIPSGLLAILPLHAIWTEDLSQSTGRLYMLDTLNVSYSPSAHALWIAKTAKDRPSKSILVVDDPDGTLAFSADESQVALDGFTQSQHLVGAEAKLDIVKREMQKASVLHFSTHGVAGWHEAEKSCLKMADGNLTLKDIFRLDLNQTRLTVLSACETGIPGLELIDEMIGLPSGMMQAGVPGVIGSLWSVNDMSTAMLMAYFYNLWSGEGVQPQEALRQAQIWLRDSTVAQKKIFIKHLISKNIKHSNTDTLKTFYSQIGWNDPADRLFESLFYWAAFSYTGI